MSTDQLIYGAAMLLAGLLVWRFSVQYDQFLEIHRERNGNLIDLKQRNHPRSSPTPAEPEAPPSRK